MSRFLTPSSAVAADAQTLAASITFVMRGDREAAVAAIDRLDYEPQRIVDAYTYLVDQLVGLLASATCSTPTLVLDAIVLTLAAEAARS